MREPEVTIRYQTEEEMKWRQLIERACDLAVDRGRTRRDEWRFARIEALLRDALGQTHGVWRWRCDEEYIEKMAQKFMKAGVIGTPVRNYEDD
jgi:hypothetical protein